MNRSIRGFNQENIQDMNRTLLLNLLRKEGICARAHLANLSQLKQATVTNIVSDFIDWGLVKEVGFLVGNKGRRSIGISINNDDFGVLAIRLARKNTKNHLERCSPNHSSPWCCITSNRF